MHRNRQKEQMEFNNNQPPIRGVGSKPWIKMRADLWDDPRVLILADHLKTDEGHVIGGLYRLWSLADLHSVDGKLPGYSASIIDRRVGLPGFANAMVEVGWLGLDESGAKIPDFEIHNGLSAKKRAQGAARKQKERASVVSSGNEVAGATRAPSRNERDKNATRVDQTRQEQNKEESPPPDGDWEKVVELLLASGVNLASDACCQAKSNGYTPAIAICVIEAWHKRKDLKPGALYARLTKIPPSVDPNEWPKKKSHVPNDELDGLVREFGTKFNLLSPSEVMQLGEISIPTITPEELEKYGRTGRFKLPLLRALKQQSQST
jgi:hypothetical protein